MDFIQLICILLMITCCSTSPVISTTEKPIELTTKSTSELVKSTTNGLISSTTISPLLLLKSNQNNQNVQIIQSTKLSNLLTRIRPVSTINVTSKTDALYQMANNLLQKEKNWLQTEKWLIDNVYRLRNELGDIKRELSDQKKLNLILSQKASTVPLPATTQQLQFVPANEEAKNHHLQDSLRTDHRMIAQQQQLVIQLTKDNQQQLNKQTDHLRQLTTMVKDQFKSVAAISQAMASLQQINDSTSGSTNQLISKLMYDLSALSTTSSAATEQLDAEKDRKSTKQQRSINPRILQFLKAENNAEHKLEQLNQEVHSLHSITMNLSKELTGLQKKVIKTEQSK